MKHPFKLDKSTVAACRLSDLVGADIGMHVGKNFVEAFPDRVYITQLMILLNKYKRLGEKTGKGFYKVRMTTLNNYKSIVLLSSKSPGKLCLIQSLLASCRSPGQQLA